MSELSEAISEMRNMRESYDQLAAAAEAYNEGKPALAEAITAKGVEAAATDSLASMAEKVMTISQDTYEINGGEMYAKQLFGSLDTPNYWNLYDILAQLLSDGRLVNYGGILLAEYYKGYDSLALSGAGAGGAYVVSDKDENGQFKIYTADTTHIWAIEDDGKGNRWVAYCFADEYHDFSITNTSTSPRSIFIGRKVGTITSLVNARICQIVVPDGNELISFNTQTYTQNFDKKLIVRNVKNQSGVVLYYSYSTSIEGFYFEADSITRTLIKNVEPYTNSSSIPAVIIKANNIDTVSGNEFISNTNIGYLYLETESLTNATIFLRGNINQCILKTEYYPYTSGYGFCGVGTVKNLLIGYITNDKTRSVRLEKYPAGVFEIIELQNGYCKSIHIANILGSLMTEEKLYSLILQRLKQDEAGCGSGVTITLGTSNLNKLTSAESVALLATLRNTYGYTFA